jgi:hypothetical protein
MMGTKQFTVTLVVASLALCSIAGMIAGVVLTLKGKPGGEYVGIAGTGIGALAAMLASTRTGSQRNEKQE